MSTPHRRRTPPWIFSALAAVSLLALPMMSHAAESRAPATACRALDECLRLVDTLTDCDGHCGVSKADEALAQAIWEIGPRAIPGLIALLDAPSEQVRDRAGYVLAYMPGLDAAYPNITDWLERIHARPAYDAALKAGGPYAYA